MKKEDRQTVESYVKSGVNRAIRETGEKSGIGTITPGSKVAYSGVNPIVYSAPSGSAYPSEPILTSKVSGWVGVFGDHYLCQLGCKRYVSKRLDDVIKFFEREVRLWYKAKELVKKGKLDVEVKGHVRKPRKKKALLPDEQIDKAFLPEVGEPDTIEGHLKKKLIDTSKHSEIFDVASDLTDEQLKRRKARYEEGICDDVVDEKVKVSDEVPEGKVLFVKDENIKVDKKQPYFYDEVGDVKDKKIKVKDG